MGTAAFALAHSYAGCIIDGIDGTSYGSCAKTPVMGKL
jgi:hypothetical protein